MRQSIYINRIEQVRDLLLKQGMDSVLISSQENILYFSGFSCTEGDAILLITLKSQYLFTDFRYQFDAAEKAKDYTLIITTYADSGIYNLFAEKIKSDNCSRCGYESNKISCRLYEDNLNSISVTFLSAEKIFTDARMIKDDYEITSLQTAQSFADNAYKNLLKRIHSGMTEKEVKAELEYLCAKEGSEGPSFETIVASGPNAACCHAVPTNRILQKGDLVVVDFGCIFNGYHSDMTRTFGVIDIDDISKKIYHIVLEAQNMALCALKSGISGKELDYTARSYIESQGYGKDFGHGLGHGFGLQIHESPRASVRSDDILLSGMTITIEPGIYLENFGGVRIEDCCLVTENGYLDFTKSSKELVLID